MQDDNPGKPKPKLINFCLGFLSNRHGSKYAKFELSQLKACTLKIVSYQPV